MKTKIFSHFYFVPCLLGIYKSLFMGYYIVKNFLKYSEANDGMWYPVGLGIFTAALLIAYFLIGILHFQKKGYVLLFFTYLGLIGFYGLSILMLIIVDIKFSGRPFEANIYTGVMHITLLISFLLNFWKKSPYSSFREVEK